jgi:hypothetical protein
VKLTQVSVAKDGHENNRGTAGNDDLYSVHPEIITGGHIIYS